MPYSTKWYKQSRVLHLRIWGKLDKDGLAHMSEELKTYLDAGIAPIYLIGDDSDVTSIPGSIGQLSNVLTFMKHPKLAWIIALGEVNPIINFLIPVVSKILGVNFIRRKNFEEAIHFLNKHEPTLITSEIST